MTVIAFRILWIALRTLVFPTALPVCGIIVPIPVGCAFGLRLAERDIDPGIATRRQLCMTQARRSLGILDIFQGNERYGLRDVRTILGRLPVTLYSFPACPGLSSECKRREVRPAFLQARRSPRRIGRKGCEKQMGRRV